MQPRVSYFFSEEIGVHASVEGQLLKPHILKLTHELIKAYELPQHLRMCHCGTSWQPASAADINRFHTDMYVAFLQELTCNAASVAADVLNHVLNQSVCFAENAWVYSSLYAGGSLAAAQALVSGDDVAINLMGGQTHARRDCASGFSFVNDAVLAILHLLRAPPASLEDASSGGETRRVLFLNLDGWHSSGVEEAFFTTNRVMCISLHRYAEGIFPGSGGARDTGMDGGKAHNINLPVSDGLDDEGFKLLLLPVLHAAVERYCPHCIVCCAGAGVISGDRLGCLNVSLEGYSAVIKELAALSLPLLVLGGGGFTQLNAAKAWTSATATLCGVELPRELPNLDSLACYPPHELQLAVPRATMADMNSTAALEATRDAALETIASQPQQTKPLPRTKKPLLPPAEAPAEAPSAPSADADGAAEAGGADGAPSAPAAGGADGAAAIANGSTGSDGGAGAAGGGAQPAASEAAAEVTGGESGEKDAAMEAEGGAEGGGGGDGDAMEVDDGAGGDDTGEADEKRMQAEEPGLGDDE